MEGANEEDLSDRKDSQWGDCEWLCAQPMIDLREPAALHWGVAVFSGRLPVLRWISIFVFSSQPFSAASGSPHHPKTPRILPSFWKVLIFWVLIF